jgi:hypothetical protein
MDLVEGLPKNEAAAGFIPAWSWLFGCARGQLALLLTCPDGTTNGDDPHKR